MHRQSPLMKNRAAYLPLWDTTGQPWMSWGYRQENASYGGQQSTSVVREAEPWTETSYGARAILRALQRGSSRLRSTA